MKNMLKSSIVLLLFAVSAVLFNISCEKEALAQTSAPSTPTALGLLLFSKDGDKSNELWLAKYDGTNQTKITIASFPTGGDIDRSTIKMSPDGKKIFFCMYIPGSNVQSIYSCNADGTGLTKLIDNVDEIAQAL
ncbi:MAG: TolB family protein [Bacteroidota bacterium]|jgi:Tol biopolymer transport system component